MGKAAKPRNGGGGTVADSRFAAVHYDPRFQRFPKAKSQVEIDERFAGIFKDEAFQVTSTVDKRGRKVQRSKKTEDMHRYYRLKEERQPDAERTGKQTPSATQPGKAQERDGVALTRGKPGGAERDVVEEQAAEERWARMRGLAGPETSSDDGDEGSDTADESSDGASDRGHSEEEGLQLGQELLSAGEDEALNEADLEEWGVGALAANPEEQIPLLPDATARLAAVDLDWEHVRAVDILAVMRSFVPKGGSILSVVVYPSDYGLERMGQEAVLGPQGIFKSAQGRKDGELGKEGGGSGSDSEEGGEVDQRRLRMYERSKLRYFYAIIACDSTVTANRLYEECDGMEFMKTACKFDLRFVPEEQSFKGRQVRDEALDVPADYMPLTFQARALQHTNVQLTWDADDDARRRALTRRLNNDELKEDDFKAYLASESEDFGEDGSAGPEEGDEEIRQRYRMLLAEGPGVAAQERHGKKDWGAGVAEEGSEGGSGSDDDAHQEAGATRVQGDKGMEMEVTFLPGLENLGERLLARKRDEEARRGETVWEAYMRRKRQKRAEAKRQGRHFASDESDGDSDVDARAGSGSDEDLPAGVAGDPFFQSEADPFDDPFFTEARGEHVVEEAGPARVKKVKGQGALAGEAKRSKKGARQTEAQSTEDAARRAELEMLLLDDAALMTARKRGSSTAGQSQQQAAKKLSKKERMRLRKSERRRERQEGSDDEDAPAGGTSAVAGVNLSDPRFAELVTSHHFALDPTDPRFKDTSASLAAEVAKRRSTVLKSSSKRHQQQQQQQQGSRPSQHSGSAAASKADLTLLVASLKRKTAAVQSGQARPAVVPSNKAKAKKRKT